MYFDKKLNEVLVVITAAIFCLLVLVNSRRKW